MGEKGIIERGLAEVIRPRAHDGTKHELAKTKVLR